MKSILSLIALIAVCGAIACAVIYLNRQKTSPPPALAAAPAAEQSPTPEKIAAPKTEAPKNISENVAQPAPAAVAAAPAETKSEESANPIRKSVDALLSAKSAAEKHDLFQQLVKSGQIDAAITELKQRAADNPNDAGIPTTLGEAQLNKLRAVRDAGGDQNEIGILAMQADQSFNAALKIDPSNWEAQFVKYSTIAYWPADAKRDNEAAEKLSHLIDQQETMSQQPGFAQTYVALGNLYQKLGKAEFAETTWRLGLAKFPNDPTLQKKLSGRQ